ncbi:MAG: hybrid sensor histidine kinase/response regulator [Gammaproteobacteria bacterium]|nr:hybrid sensor histidine kinase/response regulator [Gammaproteobacteria bacterium]
MTLTAYLALLFWIAQIGDRRRFSLSGWARHPLVYTFAIGVYCTSWTFYGLVGTAASQGWYYLPILLGPFLLFTLGYPLLRRVATVCRQENIHSIADFIASRYGKRQSVAAVVTLLMLIATVPYIALQLKAVSDTLLYSVDTFAYASQHMTLLVAGAMILFTLIFGANRLNVASYHSGIMVAVAFESLVKVIALVVIAIFALGLSRGFNSDEISNSANIVFQQTTLTPSFWVLTLISAATIFCLPRMFQVTFVECLSDAHLRYARRGFSLYLVAIAIAVFVIAWVGNQALSTTDVPSDRFVLALPLSTGNQPLALLAVIGGFSAATAMIIVASVTLSQMLSNDVILPLLMRKQASRSPIADYSRALIFTRRLTVIVIVMMAWLYQLGLAENVALTDIGLIAFALAVQLAPAILFGLYWQSANAWGVFAGLTAGTLIWFVSLMLPLLANAGFIDQQLISDGLFGIAMLQPEQLFGATFSDAYTRGVVLSISINVLAFYLASSLDKTRLSDRIQAIAFVRNKQAAHLAEAQGLQISQSDLSAMLTQFLGQSTTQRLLDTEEQSNMQFVSTKLLDAAEQALAGVVGVASARAMLTNLSRGESLDFEDVVNIFEETTRSLQFNQDVLFASFESMSSAISVVNANLEIVAWNKRYEQMFNYPKNMLRVGRPVADLVRFNAERGMLGAGSVEQHVQTRLGHLTACKPYRVVRQHHQGVIEIKGRPLPNGGYVTTYDDITEFIHTQNELEKINITLEQRVQERTREIENINKSLLKEVEKRRQTESELITAKSAAEIANASKTRFLALASHDILQPLNAASLYASALLEKRNADSELLDNLHHLHGAIYSAELIISNLLEIARLDTGALTATKSCFPLNDMLETLANEYRVQTDPNVRFHWQPTSLWTESDPKYLRRILQNFLSNAVKYTTSGKIVLGCRRRSDAIEICVYDTGPGISEAHQQRIFDDFYRITSNNHVEGAGLGLGIALRFSDMLEHKMRVYSKDSRGSLFSIMVPRRKQQIDERGSTQGTGIKTGLENLSIFYVDDDDHNIHALGSLMENWGCLYSSAENHQAAVDYAREHAAPDALLMDYQLGPGSNGIELAAILQELWQGTPVCIVSAAPDDALLTLTNQHNYDFLRKPIKPGKLRALLERYLEKKNR